MCVDYLMAVDLMGKERCSLDSWKYGITLQQETAFTLEFINKDEAMGQNFMDS